MTYTSKLDNSFFLFYMQSHHSHSGQYVSHAVDSLEDVVKRAETMGFTHFCLTEHMPRLADQFLYPEEIEKGYTKQNLIENFQQYLVHAVELQKKYNSKEGMKVLIGFEIEGLDDDHINYTAEKLLKLPGSPINMTVGSVHYVHDIPIDFSAELWAKARDATEKKTARNLYYDYFALQNKVIDVLAPQVIGHFDLIRLFQPNDEIDPTTGKRLGDIDVEQDWPEVWEIIVKNIKLANANKSLFELNSAAIRKGWDGPYPKVDICEAVKTYGGARFCFSDDSHAIKQVGLNYHKVWDYVCNVLGLEFIYHLDLEDGKTVNRKLLVKELSKSKFWQQYADI